MGMHLKPHKNHTMWPSKVYLYTMGKLELNPNIPTRQLQKDISYFKNVPKPPMGTVFYWKTHPEQLQCFYEEALRREKKEKGNGRP